MSYTNDDQSVLGSIAHKGYFVLTDSKNEAEISELLLAGLIICVGDIPHHPDTLNPAYTFVPNDQCGRNLAMKGPIATLVIGRRR